jgi:hypothetical protein
MSNHIPNTGPAQMTTAQILDEMDAYKALAVDVLKCWALLLRELAARKQSHPMFAHPVMKFWEGLADESIHPQAAVLLADRSDCKRIKAVAPLRPGEQLEIAEGKKIPVAELADSGEIRSADMSIHWMDNATLKRAFGPEGIRPVHEQAEMIREEGKATRHGSVTVLHDETMLKIGNQKIKPEELRGPLMALGYTLEVSRNAKRKAG